MTFRLFTFMSAAAIAAVFSITALAQDAANPTETTGPAKNAEDGSGEMIPSALEKEGGPVSKYIGETAKNLNKISPKAQQTNESGCWGCMVAPLELSTESTGGDGTTSAPQPLNRLPSGQNNILMPNKSTNINASGSAEKLMASGILTPKQASLLNAGKPHWQSLEQLAKALNLSGSQQRMLGEDMILQFDEADTLFSKRGITAPSGCVTEAGAKDDNCDGVDDAALQQGVRQIQLTRERRRY